MRARLATPVALAAAAAAFTVVFALSQSLLWAPLVAAAAAFGTYLMLDSRTPVQVRDDNYADDAERKVARGAPGGRRGPSAQPQCDQHGRPGLTRYGVPVRAGTAGPGASELAQQPLLVGEPDVGPPVEPAGCAPAVPRHPGQAGAVPATGRASGPWGGSLPSVQRVRRSTACSWSTRATSPRTRRTWPPSPHPSSPPCGGDRDATA